MAVIVCTEGQWTSEVSFVECDDFRITVDGPGADEVKVEVSVEFEEQA